MRICIVSGIFPPDIGGPATYLLNICKKISDSGHKISVITFGDEYIDFPFPVQKFSRKIPPFIRLLLAFIKIIKLRKEIDIIFTLGGPWDSGIPGLLAKIILGKPMVTKVTGDIAWERARIKHLIDDGIEEFQIRRYSIEVEFFRWIQDFVVKKADRVVVPSNYLKSIVEGWGIPSHKIDIIYNAIKEEDFTIFISQAEARRELGINGKINKLILVVARLAPWKGIDMLIKILPRLNKEIRLIVVGDGLDIQRLKDLAQTIGVEKRVMFIGRIPYNRIGVYLKAADVFALPSSYEGMPHTILEAMIAGIPIVATNIGGIPELIEHGREGLLFESEDSSGLEESVSRLLEDSAMALKFIESAKEKVKQFNGNIQGEKILGILDSVANNGKRK